MAQKMIIDTDTASDDAVALVLALRDPRVEVLGITVVVGNVEVDKGVQNALYTAERCGVSVPVYRGADRPLMHEFEVAYNVHGQDGMGDVGLRLSGRDPKAMHGVDAIIELARAHAGEVTLVTLGPLTNLALALRKAPEIADMFEKVVVMGGTGDHLGNATPATEFNIWVDPEAAAIVFAARSEEEHTSELQSRGHLVCRLLLEKKKTILWVCLITLLNLTLNILTVS